MIEMSRIIKSRHIWTNHVTHKRVPWYRSNERVIWRMHESRHIQKRHVTHKKVPAVFIIGRSRVTSDWVMSHNDRVMSHMNKWHHTHTGARGANRVRGQARVRRQDRWKTRRGATWLIHMCNVISYMWHESWKNTSRWSMTRPCVRCDLLYDKSLVHVLTWRIYTCTNIVINVCVYLFTYVQTH